MKVTVKDVANMAGVSVTSVSLVLNNRPSRITEETKERIMKAAEELGYRHTAKETSNEPRTKLLGVIHPNCSNPFFNQCLKGIENHAAVSGYKIIVCNVENSMERCLGYFEILASLRVEGIIVMPPIDMNLNDNNIKMGKFFERTKIRLLLLDRAVDRVFCDFITGDNKQGAYLATEHLILSGHSDIGIIAGPREIYNCRKRIEGYKEALVYYGISIAKENIYYGDFTSRSGYRAAGYFEDRDVTAIFACNDLMALGVYQYAADHGLKIGEDLSVVGFDDIPFCDLLSPPLTTIQQPAELMGKRACELMIKRITGEEVEPPRDTYFAPSFIERKSVKLLL